MMPHAFDKDLLPGGEFSFIVHLFDRVLLGTSEEEVYRDLRRALEQDEVLEGHFFNGTMEIYASRMDGQLVVYEPIIVGSTGVEDEEHAVIERSYELDLAPNNTAGTDRTKYNKLVVREQIAYENDLAYVERAMLLRLEKEDER